MLLNAVLGVEERLNLQGENQGFPLKAHHLMLFQFVESSSKEHHSMCCALFWPKIQIQYLRTSVGVCN